ncbi:hypothetical protein BD780_000100 [Clostridium tetanomorphum]|nr:transglutaminase domain-containing protein [Clostridium tetanomorphum]KAJ52122.1 transglutaminase domain-containing protein [Clostridium tetanomorphum DSM 665]MBP1863046.1 hypothetical protein [Clostridium tetanomorphum]NRS82875.1 hypothetical protein [Clostridium tetanomorphum]NRZ99029.1 hypothetical protein [Clostridium tetanomorphum]SQC03240.1 transglutaminase-like protease [Clostridium tetanomorphum]
MKNMKKFITSFLIMICITLLPIKAGAAPDINKNNGKQYRVESAQVINKNTLDSEKNQTINTPVYKSYAEYTCYSVDDILEVVKDYCLNREESFTISYIGNFDDLHNIVDEIYDYIERTDGYLANSIKSYSGRWAMYTDGSIDLQLNISYRTTKAQEEYVDAKVSSILNNIITEYMTDDQKEKAIHDYIVANIAYDTSLTKFTAYEALYSGTTVCQGYAMLAYKMLNQVGIETKIVVGEANNGSSTESHAWNLVNLHGKWYQLDCTWDDPVPDRKGRVRYDYYNITDEKMGQDHFWERAKYPEAYTYYDMSNIDKPYEKKDLSGFKQITEKKDVAVDKVWNIDFTKSVNVDSINHNNIFVVREDEFNSRFNSIEDINDINFLNSLNKISTKIGYDENKRLLTITPQYKYNSACSYYIIITEKVLSLYGEKIPKPIIMKFTTK